jgi:hypothetical protein
LSLFLSEYFSIIFFLLFNLLLCGFCEIGILVSEWMNELNLHSSLFLPGSDLCPCYHLHLHLHRQVSSNIWWCLHTLHEFPVSFLSLSLFYSQFFHSVQVCLSSSWCGVHSFVPHIVSSFYQIPCKTFPYHRLLGVVHCFFIGASAIAWWWPYMPSFLLNSSCRYFFW